MTIDRAKLIRTIQHLLNALVTGDYETLAGDASLVRQDLALYNPVTFVLPPEGAFDRICGDVADAAPGEAPNSPTIGVVAIKGRAAWAVDIGLWEAEHGQSDLTLRMEFRDSEGDLYSYVYEDLHVL